jgi:hypothetical protein
VRVSSVGGGGLRLSARARPNVVEDGWVVGNNPALGYPTLLDPKDGDGPPLEALAAAVALACGEYDRALVVGEHPVDGDTECSVRQLASAEEVAQHVIPAAIFIRDRALSWYMPDDVIRQHCTRGVLLTAGIEAGSRVLTRRDCSGRSTPLRCVPFPRGSICSPQLPAAASVE